MGEENKKDLQRIMTFKKIMAENFLQLEESQTVLKQKNKMREIAYQIPDIWRSCDNYADVLLVPQWTRGPMNKVKGFNQTHDSLYFTEKILQISWK